MCTQRYSALTVILQMSDHKKKSQSVITAEKLKVNQRSQNSCCIKCSKDKKKQTGRTTGDL